MVQKLIADGVAEAVVDVFEAIEIDEDDGDLRFRRLRFEDFSAQGIAEMAAVRQLRDRVEVGVPPDHFLGALLFGGVGEQRHEFGAAVDGADADARQERLALAAFQPELPGPLAGRAKRTRRRGEQSGVTPRQDPGVDPSASRFIGRKSG